jgi:hypothetical protein
MYQTRRIEMDPLQELLAREEIKTTKARYCRFLDTKDWQGFASVFTENAVLDVREDAGTDPMHGISVIIETVRHVVQHAKTAHQVHSPEITFDGPDAADVIWAMEDRLVWEEGKSPIPGSTMTGYGHYHERYIRQDGRWLIASLKLTRLNIDLQNAP